MNRKFYLSALLMACTLGLSAEEVINKIQILEADYIANTPVTIPTIDFTNYMPASDSWFTLDGRRLTTKPTSKGLYIHNGRKVLIK